MINISRNNEDFTVNMSPSLMFNQDMVVPVGTRISAKDNILVINSIYGTLYPYIKTAPDAETIMVNSLLIGMGISMAVIPFSIFLSHILHMIMG